MALYRLSAHTGRSAWSLSELGRERLLSMGPTRDEATRRAGTQAEAIGMLVPEGDAG
jgi:hypothetical protein